MDSPLANGDTLEYILGKLPAKSFASAACVNKLWSYIAKRTLSRPKLASALSLNPNQNIAVREVLDKVLSEPIRPQFAIAFVGWRFSLEVTHTLISHELGSRTPVITSASNGIIGVDAMTDEIEEVNWGGVELNPHGLGFNFPDNFNRGIVLVVGMLPGLKVDAIPLLRPEMFYYGPDLVLIERFINDIRNFSISASGGPSPSGIILFGDHHIDVKPVLAELDFAMPEETWIVGDSGCRCLCKSVHNAQNYFGEMHFLDTVDAAALVFARDQNRPADIGEILFHVSMSPGIMPFGPQLQTHSVSVNGADCSWLIATLDGGALEGEELLNDIHQEIEDVNYRLYLGVTQEWQNLLGPLSMEPRRYISYYNVLGGDNMYLIIDGVGVNPGDSFLFYHSHRDTASTSCANVFQNLRISSTSTPSTSRARQQIVRDRVFGGFIFSSRCRGAAFFGRPNLDTSPFRRNFPGVPLAGAFCDREIGRQSEPDPYDGDLQAPTRCAIHVYSTVYLVLSYVPPP